MRKVYEALAVGRVDRDLREIVSSIEGQVTRVTVIDAISTRLHLRLAIETGRTHQIRRHLEGRGHPIAGDKAYGTARAGPWGEPPLDPAADAPRGGTHAGGIRRGSWCGPE